MSLSCAALLMLAHPVPVQSYDRTVTVRLTPGSVVVEYVLEVDSFTALADVPDLVSKEERARITRPAEVHAAFARASAPILANNLLARLDGKTLTFTCTRQTHKLLDHLRCEYRFEAPLSVMPGKSFSFTFREANYDEEPGGVRLSLDADPALHVLKSTQPDEALKKRPEIDLRPGDRDRLRTASATFEFFPGRSKPGGMTASTARHAPAGAELVGTARPAPPTTTDPPTALPETKPTEEPATEPSAEVTFRRWSLKDLLFESDFGFWALMALAAVFGAAHALTPGHGKTLVAAYLVGQRGTSGHAVLLGLLTAITHTGAVLLVAAVLPLLFPDVRPSAMQQVLGFVGGLMIAALGFWLLYRRLAGKADHFHLPGTDHHHPAPGSPLRLTQLVWLGVWGGIVPCGDALALFILAVRWERLELAFPLLLAFSAGLAFVLVAVGLGVVWAARFTTDRMKGDRAERLARILPLVSAVLITAVGLWLCYDSVPAGPP